MHIRPETARDVAAITAVTLAAFRQAPYSSHTEHHIVHALRAAGALVVSLVAEVDGVVVGHVALSPVHMADGSPGWLGLGPVSVLPAHQGQGVGQALVRAALAAAHAGGAGGCVVLGDPGYYARFGFAVQPGLTLAGVPPDYFQALRWKGQAPYGEVCYDPAFAAVA